MKRSNASKTTIPPTSAQAAAAKPVKKPTSIPAMDIQREVKPPTDEVRRRAYEIYLQRTQRGEPGSPESDWGRAELELRQR